MARHFIALEPFPYQFFAFVNTHIDHSLMTNTHFLGLVGLVAYVPAGGDLFSIEGGNYKLMTSAIRQANKMYETSNCSMTAELPRVQRHQKTITTLVSSEESMELFSNDESLGSFDIVILGATWYLTLIFLMSY